VHQKTDKFLINNVQFWTLLTCVTWPAVIGYGGGISAREAGHDMLSSGILAVFMTILFVIILIYTGRKWPGSSIIEYSKKALGAIPGKFLGLGLMGYFLVSAYLSMIIFIHHVNDFMLPETPFMLINVIYVFIVSYLVWQGPEVIVRVSVIAFILGGAFNALVFLATLQEVNFNRLLPVFDASFLNIGLASLKITSFTGQALLVLAMLLPMVKEPGKITRPAIKGIIIGSIFFIFYFIAELMVMGPHVTAMMRVVCMDLVRAIQITEYLHRFESFMVSLWYWSMLVQAGILTYCTKQAFKEITGVKKYDKWIIAVTALILIALNHLLGQDRVVFLNYLEYVWPYISLPVQFGLPLLLLLVAIFTKAKS